VLPVDVIVATSAGARPMTGLSTLTGSVERFDPDREVEESSGRLR
jgi:hypothetical protein